MLTKNAEIESEDWVGCDDEIEETCKLTRLSFETLSEKSKEQCRNWRSSQKPVDRNNWHVYFILQAYLVSTRSLDAQTQCGCVLVKDKAVIGTGYNSFIRNIKDNVLPNLRPDKYPFMIHSEHNAVLNCARHGISCEGAFAYVTGPPCCSCLQYMYQAGIKAVYFANNNKANMNMNSEYDIQFEILSHLIHKGMEIFCLDIDRKTLEKINKIKSC
jgi:dCMP deaminase